jgi:putative colanic acid biosynthesis acetyltransferase WcaF
MESGERPPLQVDLRLFSTREGLPGGDNKGRPVLVRALWLVVNALVMRNPLLPLRWPKIAALRAFGARVGDGVRIKPSVNVSRPWNLEIGDHTWIGEGVWLDSTAPLRIGSHVVISQGAFLSCGMHDWQDPGMGSVTAPITVEDGAWIASFARVAGNVTVGQEAVVALGSVVFTDCEPRGTYRGNPAQKVGIRRIRKEPGPPKRMSEAKT